jgi:hypothetical protein
VGGGGWADSWPASIPRLRPLEEKHRFLTLFLTFFPRENGGQNAGGG